MIAYVQNIITQSILGPTPQAITVTANTTAGNVAVMVVRMGGAVSVTGVTDSKGNTWTVQAFTSSGGTIAMCWAVMTTPLLSSDTITITKSANSQGAVIVAEYSGIDTASPIHGSNATPTASSQTGSSGVVAVSDPNVALVAGHANNLASLAVTIPGGYTSRFNQGTTGTAVLADLLPAGSTGSINSTWTWTGLGNSNSSSALIAFNPAVVPTGAANGFFGF